MWNQEFTLKLRLKFKKLPIEIHSVKQRTIHPKLLFLIERLRNNAQRIIPHVYSHCTAHPLV